MANMTYDNTAPLQPINTSNNEYHYAKTTNNDSNVYDAIADTTTVDSTALYSQLASNDGSTGDDPGNGKDGIYSLTNNEIYSMATNNGAGTDDGEYSQLNRDI